MARKVVECVLYTTERIEVAEDVSVKAHHSRVVWMGGGKSGPPSRTKSSAHISCCSRSPILTRPSDDQIPKMMRDKTEGHRWPRDR